MAKYIVEHESRWIFQLWWGLTPLLLKEFKMASKIAILLVVAYFYINMDSNIALYMLFCTVEHKFDTKEYSWVLLQGTDVEKGQFCINKWISHSIWNVFTDIKLVTFSICFAY